MTARHHNLMENGRMNSLQFDHEIELSEKKTAEKLEKIHSEMEKKSQATISQQIDEMWNAHRLETEISEKEKERQIEESFASHSTDDDEIEDTSYDESSDEFNSNGELEIDSESISSGKYSGNTRAQRRKSSRKTQKSQEETARLAGLSVKKMYNDGNVAHHEVSSAAQKAAKLAKGVKST